MADVRKTVEILFEGKNSLGNVTNAIGRDFDTIGGNIMSITGPLDRIADKILTIEGAIAALTVGAIGIAVKKAGEFGDSFREISTLVDASSQDIAKFRQEILNYATDSDRSLADINQAVYKAISAGIDYRTVLGTLKTAEELAQAGRNDLASTTVLLAGTMNAYGAKTNEAEHYSDVFMQTIRKGLTTLPELAGSLANVTGISAMAKVPIETLSAALAALTSTGIPTEQAVTGIKNVLQNIIKPSAEAEKEAKKLGIQFNAQALASKGLEAVLWDAWRATKGNSEEMSTLFGSIRGLNVATVLASDSGGRFKSTLLDMAAAAGTLGTASSKMTGQFEDINQKILNNIDVALIGVGDRFYGTYGDIADGLTKMFAGVKVGMDAGSFDPVFNFINETGRQLADRLKVIAANLPEAMEGLDFSGLIKSLEGLGGALGDAFAAIFGEIDLSTPEGLHELIQKLIDGFAALTNVTHGIIDGLKPLFSLIGEGIDQFSSMDSAGAELIGRIMGVAKSINILAEYSGLLTGVLALLALEGVGKLITDLGRLGGTLISIVPGVADFIKNVGLLGSAGLVGAAGAVGYLTGSLINQIPVVGSASQSLLGLIDVHGDFFGAQSRTAGEMKKLDSEFEMAKKKHLELTAAVHGGSIATDVFTQSVRDQWAATVHQGDTIEDVTKKIAAMTVRLKDLPEKKQVGITVLADGTSIEKAWGMIIEKFPDGSSRITQAKVSTDSTNLADAKKKIDDTVPAVKVMEIEASIDIARIKEQSEIVQKAIEWKAKVDIAEIEAGTKKIEAAFKSIDNTMTSTGETLQSIIGNYVSALTAGQGGRTFIEQMAREESERRERALILQEKLTYAQIEYMKAQTTAMSRGDALIRIDGSGLAPHLEAFMFEILSAIQVRANAEGARFLVGV